jgi:uncharacterized membrane protein YagU involved in acid resistance
VTNNKYLQQNKKLNGCSLEVQFSVVFALIYVSSGEEVHLFEIYFSSFFQFVKNLISA